MVGNFIWPHSVLFKHLLWLNNKLFFIQEFIILEYFELINFIFFIFDMLKRKIKAWTLLIFRRKVNNTIELIDDQFTYHKTKANSINIYTILLVFDWAKQLEHLGFIFIFDSNTFVSYTCVYLIFVYLHYSNINLSTSCEFNGIWKQINYYLLEPLLICLN